MNFFKCIIENSTPNGASYGPDIFQKFHLQKPESLQADFFFKTKGPTKKQHSEDFTETKNLLVNVLKCRPISPIVVSSADGPIQVAEIFKCYSSDFKKSTVILSEYNQKSLRSDLAHRKDNKILWK